MKYETFISSLLDPKALEQLRLLADPNEGDLIAELLQRYETLFREKAPLVEKAIAFDDTKSLQQQIQAMRSSARSLGFQRVALLCEKIALAEDERVSLEQVAIFWKDLKRAHQESVQALKKLMKSNFQASADFDLPFPLTIRLSIGTVITVSLLVILGWLADIALLKSIMPGYVSMKFHTAVCFLFLSVTFLLWWNAKNDRKRWITGSFFLFVPVLLSSVTLLQQVMNWQSVIHDAPLTAINFLVLSAAMALGMNRFNKVFALSQLMVLFTLLVSFQGLVGYFLGATDLFGLTLHTQFALHTTILFCCLSVAILCTMKESGFLAEISSESLGAVMGRRLIIAAIIVPFLITWFQMTGQSNGFFSEDEGSLLRLLTNVIIFIAIAWRIAATVNKADFERQLVQENLDSQRALFEITLEQMRIGVIIAEAPSGRLLFANPPVQTVFRHPLHAQLINDYGGWRAFHPDGRPYQAEDWPLARAIQKGEVIANEDTSVLRGDGTRGIVRISASPVRNRQGRIIAGVSTCEDRTELLEREDERAELAIREKTARAAAGIKSEFLANMSHEIRTPLNGVIGMTGLLLNTSLNNQQRDFAETIGRSANYLLTLINDILDFSKIEAGKMELENVSFNLHEVISDAHRTMYVAAREKDLSLVMSLPPGGELWLKGDPSRLRQVLNNLLSNAIKFTSKGSVQLKVTELPANGQHLKLRFEVKDTGIGIARHNIDKLFTSFSQAESSTSRRYGGTGLGLSISKKIVEMMGGSIGVESTEGAGSTFWFTASFESGMLDMLTKAELAVMKPSGQKQGRILIVEDNSINQKVALAQLKNLGYQADIAANGREAIEALQLLPYDLVLMDCQMPEMDGFETTKMIRESTSRIPANIPIIAMTANALKGDREKCIEAGMNDYVSKPTQTEELGKVIEKWMNPNRKVA